MAVVERWSPPDLGAAVTCVTGGSYGVGRGIAEVLGTCGATVYVTGRGSRRWTVEETAELVSERGGTGVPVRLDHTDDRRVPALFSRIEQEHGRLDLLVNNVWQCGPPEARLAPRCNRRRDGTPCSASACGPTSSPPGWRCHSWSGEAPV